MKRIGKIEEKREIKEKVERNKIENAENKAAIEVKT